MVNASTAQSVLSLVPLKLYRAISRQTLQKVNDKGCLSLEDSDRNWLAFKESVQDAFFFTWDGLTKENMVLISLTVTSEGVGHYMREGKLFYLSKYLAWRFYVDVPVLVVNERGETLLFMDDVVNLIQ